MSVRSLRDAIVREFENAPIATTVTAVGALAGIVFFAWPHAEPTSMTRQINSTAMPVAHIGGILAAIAIATFFGGLSRLAFRYAKLASFVISLIFAAVSVVVTALALTHLGIGFPLNRPDVSSTENLIYWLNIFIFLAINGETIAKAFVVASNDPKKDIDGGGAFAVLAFGAAIWGGLLGRAQDMLIGTPPILTP